MKNESMTTWNRVLDEFVILLTKDEKRAFEAALGVTSPSTVIRWRRGDYIPGPDQLEKIYMLLPEELRQKFVSSLQRDPRAWMKTPLSLRELMQGPTSPEGSSLVKRESLDPFFRQLLRLQREATDRFWEIGRAVLYEAVIRLETNPNPTGMNVSIAVFSPPRDGEKVHSLRAFSIGTSPWADYPHYEDAFLGAETLAGRVVTQLRSDRVLDLQQQGITFSVAATEHERSTAASPILNSLGVAGAFVVSSVQADYFTGERMDLIELFADLLRLAFYDHEFRAPSSLDIRLMPERSIQRQYFLQNQQRVGSLYRGSHQEGSQIERSLLTIEAHVRQQMEEEVLRLMGGRESIDASRTTVSFEPDDPVLETVQVIIRLAKKEKKERLLDALYVYLYSGGNRATAAKYIDQDWVDKNTWVSQVEEVLIQNMGKNLEDILNDVDTKTLLLLALSNVIGERETSRLDLP